MAIQANMPHTSILEKTGKIVNQIYYLNRNLDVLKVEYNPSTKKNRIFGYYNYLNPDAFFLKASGFIFDFYSY